MSTAIIFLLVLTVLVFVHELGHFLAARLFKIRVDEFAIGFPPRVFSWMWGKTRYAINLLPLGGYVKIYGENPDDERTSDSILAKPRWQQAVVLVAGVTFNIILAWILLSGALMLGTKASVASMPAELVKDPVLTVVMLAPGSPAEKAGLRAGAEILSITDGSDMVATTSLSVESVQRVIATAETDVTLEVMQKGTSTDGIAAATVVITPVEGIAPGKKAIGISMDYLGEARAPFFSAFYYGAQQTYHLTINVALGLADFLKNIFIGNASLSQVSGPVGIAGVVGESAQVGFASLLVIAAVISANLAVLNLAPFPALDGGRLVVVLVESVIRRDVSPKILMWVNGIGFLLLISLMILVTVKDVFVLVN